MSLSSLAVEIAIRVPYLAQDCAINRAYLIENLIKDEVKALTNERDAEILRLRAELTAFNEKCRVAEEAFQQLIQELRPLPDAINFSQPKQTG